MEKIKSFVFDTVLVADHLLPIVITIFAIVAIVAFIIGRPYIKHIMLVAGAGNIDGEIKLAQHLAKKAGGRNIDNKNAWKGFIPAARELHNQHQIKRTDVDSSNSGC